MRLAWYFLAMILSNKNKEYFKYLQAKVSQPMARFSTNRPYLVEDDPVITNYEIIREVWFEGIPIKDVCQRYTISRSQYYEREESFVKHGLLGLFPEVKTRTYSADLECLIVLASKARPFLSQQDMLRIAEAVPITQEVADIDSVSQVLASHGRSASDQPADLVFFSRIQRTLDQLRRLKQQSMKGRDKKRRKETFFQDKDYYHKRLELMRELFFDRSAKTKEICLQYAISQTSYYRLVHEYRLFGPWAVIPAYLPGKEAMSSDTELNIILQKLRHPYFSAQEIVKALKLRCSRYAVNRVFSRWSLTDKKRAPVALDQYCSVESRDDREFTGITSAWHLYTEQSLLELSLIHI